MKAITSGENSDGGGGGVYCPSSRSGATASTKVTKHRRDVENEEIRAYLSKLKELVPCMPKNRRLSKLEVIQYVIDYICDLQHALETHPSVSSVAVHSAAAAAVMLSAAASQGAGVNLQNMLGEVSPPQHRQPLAILAPNANANASLQSGHHNNTRTCSGSVSVSESSPSPSSASSPAPLTISSSSCDGSGSDSR